MTTITFEARTHQITDKNELQKGRSSMRLRFEIIFI